MSRLRSLLSARLVRRARRTPQRGLTLLEIMIVIAILGLLVVIIVPRVIGSKDDAELRLTKIAVDKIANEWYTRWDLASDEPCPKSVLELAQAVKATADDIKDPWGNEYKLYTSCLNNLPSGVTGSVGILSMGPDRKEGTEDDIKSWERMGKKPPTP